MTDKTEKIERTESHLFRDFLGILTLGFTAFSLTALFSYQSADPSFNNYVAGGKQTILNHGGIVGAYLSDALAQTFGSGAFFFPVVTFLMGWILILGNEFRRWPIVLSSGFLMLVNLCALLSISWSVDPFFEKRVKAGGVAGTFLGDTLRFWFNDTGALLMVGTLLTVSVVAMTGVTVNSLIKVAVEILKNLARRIWSFLQAFVAKVKDVTEKAKIQVEETKEIFTPKEPVIVSMEREAPVTNTEPEIVLRKKKKIREKEPFAVQKVLPFAEVSGNYSVPSLSLLDDLPPKVDTAQAREEILARSKTLEKKLADFGVNGRVAQVLPGPVITLYEFEPAPGIKVSRILSLTDDLALAMRSASVRILAPVPGKPVVGIEIPNPRREIVSFKEIISSDEFRDISTKLAMVLGKDNIGNPVALDLAQVPQLLIAGATGSGKSVGVNALICSILLNASPDEVKMIMIDPKMLELSIFDGIPHLIAPVVTNPKKAASALQWAVTEMERRYKEMAERGVRNISGYNELLDKLIKEREEEQAKKVEEVSKSEGVLEENEPEAEPQVLQKMPYIVIFIDELADLMMVASKGVEECLTRLAQMARAAGIHLILATQRPSEDVLTGIIKANFPARISYQVTSRVDSRTNLDSVGAEKLLGKGDMLFLPPSLSRLVRIHGAMVKDSEISRILQFIKQQQKPDYSEDIFVSVENQISDSIEEEDYDEKYDEALALIAREQQATISMIQRKLRIGYNRAARIIEVMEKEGVVGPSDGIKPREVYVKDVPAT